MREIKKLKKFIPILLGLMIILLPFGNFKAFAAVDSGFNSPSVKSSNGVNVNNTIDNNIGTYGYVYNGTNFIYNIPSYASTFRIYANSTSYFGSNYVVDFLNSSGSVVNEIYQPIAGTGTNSAVTKFDFSVPTGTVAVRVTYGAQNNLNIYEVEYNASITHTEISNLIGTPGNNNISLSWGDLSGNTGFTGYKVYKNGSLIATLGTAPNSFNDTGLTVNTSYTYKVTATYADGVETSGISQTVKTFNPPPGNVTNLKGNAQKDKVDLSWNNPTDSLFSGNLNIYRDGTLIGSSTGTTYTDSNVSAGTSYTYKVTTLSNNGAESNGVTTKINTQLNNATGLKASANSYSVDLSWTNPNEPMFQSVNIYRNGILMGNTNKNTFTDQNLSASTDYTYTIKAVSTDGSETTGVTLKTTTQSPVMVGTQYTQQPNGDVKITWQQPTTGTVNIYVGGKLYATVDASKLQELVLAADVVKTPFGDYAMSVQPVSPNGITGDKVQAPQMGGQQLPFSASELAQSGTNLLWYSAPLILLALTFLIVPKLRKLLFDSIRRIRGKEVKEQTRRTDQEPKEEREPRERQERELRDKQERHEGKEHLEKTGLLQRMGLSKQTEPDVEKRKERQQRNRELKEITELAAKQPRIREERVEKEGRVQRITRTLREPRERIKQARERQREPRQPRERTRQPRLPRGSRGE